MEEILEVYPDFDFEYFHKIAKKLYDLMNHKDFEKWLKIYRTEFVLLCNTK